MAKFDGLRASTIGIHFLVSTLIGFYFGSWLDGWFDTGRTFSLIGAFLGILAGFLNLFREVQILNAADEAEQKRLLESLDDPAGPAGEAGQGSDRGNDENERPR